MNMDFIEQWKRDAAAAIKEYARVHHPFKIKKVSGYYLFIDTKAKAYSLELRGVNPNAGDTRAWGAPTNKWQKGEPRRVPLPYGWKTVTKERVTSPGERVDNVRYYGARGRPQRFFGIKRKGRVRAYGITQDHVVVPVYSEQGFVEWLVEDQMDDVLRILEETGFEHLEREL